MRTTQSILVVSDIHYAGPTEQKRGSPEFEIIRNPLLRLLVKIYRNYVWRRHPFDNNLLLDQFIAQAGDADYVVANGDYSCDSAFVGLGDNACLESARLCLGKLRERYQGHLRCVVGDHELGKMSLFGNQGGLRLQSWSRLTPTLGVEPFWTWDIGRYRLIGVTSSLLALPVYEPETLPSEREQWQQLRLHHLRSIQDSFEALSSDRRVILFCHDPTALPFLWREEALRPRLAQVELTIIGHLHSSLFLWKSRLLSGMPAIHFLGNSVRRMSMALHDARHWRGFNVRLCPALSGIDLLKDGGYLRLELNLNAERPIQVALQRLRAA